MPNLNMLKTTLDSAQSLLIQYRTKKNYSHTYIASQLAIEHTTLLQLEEEDFKSIQLNMPTLLSYLKRYATFLDIPDNQINDLLIQTQKYLYQNNKPKLHWFDKINRLCIFLLFCSLFYLLYLQLHHLDFFNLTQHSLVTQQEAPKITKPLYDTTTKSSTPKQTTIQPHDTSTNKTS